MPRTKQTQVVNFVGHRGAKLPITEGVLVDTTADDFIVQAVVKTGRGRGTKTVLREYTIPRGLVHHRYTEIEIEPDKIPDGLAPIKSVTSPTVTEKTAATTKPRKKPGPKPKAKKAASPAVKKDGTPRKKPGPKPKANNDGNATASKLNKADTPRKKSGPKAKAQKTDAPVKKRGPGRPKKPKVETSVESNDTPRKKKVRATAPSAESNSRSHAIFEDF